MSVKARIAARVQHTERMRKARIIVRDYIRAQGVRPSRVPPHVITEAAKVLIEDPEWGWHFYPLPSVTSDACKLRAKP